MTDERTAEVPERVRAAFTALTCSMLDFTAALAESDLLIDRNLGAAMAALAHAGMDVSARLSEVTRGR